MQDYNKLAIKSTQKSMHKFQKQFMDAIKTMAKVIQNKIVNACGQQER